MPNKYAVIIFICSLAFAATTVFLLCLLQPKSHQITPSDPAKGSQKYGLDAYEALAGLPIKKKRELQSTHIPQIGHEFEKRIEPFYDEWAEMGLSVRSIRPVGIMERKNSEENRWNQFIDDQKVNLPKQVLPMARVLYWQDQLDTCIAYKSILCHKALSYWMTMNGLNVANIVKHGRRRLDDLNNDFADKRNCKTPNVKDPNCTRDTVLPRNKDEIDQFNEIQILNASKAGKELENANGRINLAKAQIEAQKAGLASGFIFDTKYPNDPNA